MFENHRIRKSHRVALFVLLVAGSALVAQAKGRLGPAPAPVQGVPGPPRIEVAFVLDTTGSMSGLIEGAKQKIWSIANQMASGSQTAQIRMGLIGYRDRGDAYVTRFFDLTDDIDAIYGHLQAFQAEGGGDTPESVNQALHEAVTRMSWSPSQEVYKVIFLVGDAPPHLDYPNDVQYGSSVRLARETDIVVNTVQCGNLPSTAEIWKQIAARGSGEYAAIAQNGAMVAVTTPMDDELARLNRELAGTVLAYGAEAEKAEIRAKVDRSTAAEAPVAASRLAYLEKAGGRVNLGRLDLVGAVATGEVELKDVPEEALPEEMQSMDTQDREAFVAKNLAERERIQREISSLSLKRDGYLRAETERLAAEGKGDGFDQKVLQAIRSQAARKGIRYE
jgi:hypothetical protein